VTSALFTPPLNWVIGLSIALCLSGVILRAADDMFRGMVIGWGGALLPILGLITLTGSLDWVLPHTLLFPAIILRAMDLPWLPHITTEESEDPPGQPPPPTQQGHTLVPDENQFTATLEHEVDTIDDFRH
jgi:hypothetical protein